MTNETYLPEEMHTLRASHAHPLRPGDPLTLTFIVRNPAPKPLRGLRVRLDLDDRIVVRRGVLSGDEAKTVKTATLLGAGVALGTIPRDGLVTLSVEATVEAIVEDRESLSAQAVLIAKDRELGSNIQRLEVYSRPVIAGSTTATLAGDDGGQVMMSVRIENTGTATASGLRLSVPPVPMFALVDPSAFVVDDAVLAAGDVREFVGHYAPVIGTGASSFEAKALIVSCLEVEDVVVAPPPAVRLTTPQLVVASALEQAVPEVNPGDLVEIAYAVTNPGPVRAGGDLRIAIAGPADLVRASVRVDDALAISSGKRTPYSVEIDQVDPHATAHVRFSIAIDPRASDATRVDVTASIDGSTATESFEVAARGEISPSSTAIVPADLAIGESSTVELQLVNASRAPVSPKVQLSCPAVGRWSIDRGARFASGQRSANESTVELDVDAIPPAGRRTITVAIDSIAESEPGEYPFSARSGALTLAESVVRLTGHPDLNARAASQSEPLRPNSERVVRMAVQNLGKAAADGVRLYPAAASPLATADVVDVGTILRGETIEVDVPVRLERYSDGDAPVRLDVVAEGKNMRPRRLETVWLATNARADLSAHLRYGTDIAAIAAGDVVPVVLELENTGDGPARDVIVRSVPGPANYVAGSTSLGGTPMHDAVGGFALHSDRGLIVSTIEPGNTLTVAWSLVLTLDADEGTRFAPSAVVTCDANTSTVSAQPLYVTEPAPFAIAMPINAAFAPVKTGPTETKALAPATNVVDTPPAAAPAVNVQSSSAIAGDAGMPAMEPAAAADDTVISNDRAHESIESDETKALQIVSAPESDDDFRSLLHHVGFVQSSVDLTGARLDQILNLMGKARGHGMCTHLFALRAFFPDRIVAGGDVDDRLGATRGAVKAIFDRLFVRLNISNFSIAPSDIEDRKSRERVVALVDALLSVVPAADKHDLSEFSFITEVDREQLLEYRRRLDAAPIGDALPLVVLALLMGTKTANETVTAALTDYRAKLVAELLAREGDPEFAASLCEAAPADLDSALETLLSAIGTLGAEV